MKYTYILLNILLLGIIATSLAAVSIGNYSDPKHPGKCAFNENLIIPEGDTVQNPNSCGRIICGSNGLVHFHSCGALGISDDCRFGEYLHPNADYPMCCKRDIVCN